MNWQLKARIQSLVARLPDRLSYPLYYQLQRRLGGLRPSTINPSNRMRVGIDACRQIVAADGTLRDATFFEVGTGWRINLPIACWLLGARRVVTVDLNRYLKPELIWEDIVYLRNHPITMAELFRQALPNEFDADRFHTLLKVKVGDLDTLLDTCGIEYLAPADATDTPLADHSIDYHVSCNVLEHIPHSVLDGILHEANRIVKPNGLLVHRVDHSDHFAHNDGHIPAIHFLRYSDSEWNAWADNRYAYVNRLREDDYLQLFAAAGQTVHRAESTVDQQVAELLQTGFELDERFADKSLDTLARLHTMFVASPAAQSMVRAA